MPGGGVGTGGACKRLIEPGEGVRGAEGGGAALFTVTWPLLLPGRCSLPINPSRASQAPRPPPQPGAVGGGHPGALGRQLLPGKLLALTQPGPLP